MLSSWGPAMRFAALDPNTLQAGCKHSHTCILYWPPRTPCSDIVEGVTPLIGNCTGDNPEAIQACEWTPGVLNRPKGSGGKDEKKQRFAIFF